MTQAIHDKVVVITGASSGLGEATARHLARQGAKLVLGARRLDRLQALAEVESHGRIDVIINNAGLMPQSLLERLKVEDWTG